LRGIPHIEEIARIIEIFESIGVKVEWLEKKFRPHHAAKKI